MDLALFQQNYALFLGVVVAVLVFHLSSFISNTRKKKVAPRATGGWPLVGHLNLLAGSSDLPHMALGSMAIKYGPIFSVSLGVHSVLVVNSWELAKEIFTTHDAIVSSRPKFKAAKILGYDYLMFGVSPYGPYWREMRKITSVKLLSGRRLEQINHLRVSELENSIRNLHELWRKKRDREGKMLVDMKKWFGELDMNVILRMVVGKRYCGATNAKEEREMNRTREVMREFFQMFGLFVVGDALPILGWLDLGGHEKAMRRVAKEMDCVVGKWLEEHRKKRDSGEEIGEEDFMDVMTSATKTENLAANADAIIKSTCLDIIASSADTISIMLTWTLSLLLNNRHVLQKAQDEIDKHVGNNRQVDDSDINKLVYLQAIIKETLRLYPAAPLGSVREFSQDCTLAGYHVPKGTWLIVNIWKLQHDPEIWSDPSEFKPERFLSETHKHVDAKGTNFELIPFGAGRRICPGMDLGLQMLHMILASLLQNFNISTPNDAPIDMTESAGLTNAKASPLQVQIVPRSPYII